MQQYYLGLIILGFLFFLPNNSLAQTSSNETVLEIPQLNEIKEIIQESNENDFNLFWISIGIAIVAITGSIISTIFLRKQVKILDSEFSQKSEPWLVIQNIRPTQAVLEKGAVLNWNELQKIPLNEREPIKSVKVYFKIENIGGGIAFDIHSIIHVNDTIFDRKVFEDKEDKSNLLILVPNQDFSKYFYISWKRWSEMSEHNIFVGLSVSYVGQIKRKYTGGIYRMYKGGTDSLDPWMTK